MKKKAKTLKFKSDYSMEDMKLIYRTCSLHSSTDSEFGIFCLGAAMILRSIFKELQIPDHYAPMDIKINEAAILSVLLLDGLDSAKVDLETALVDGKDNTKLSNEIMDLAETYQKTLKKEE